MKRTGVSIGIAVFASLLADPSCAKTPQIGLDVVLPSSIGSQATWIELGVYPTACPPQQELMGGIPTAGIVARVAFQNGNGSPPPIGDLPRGSYAFAAVARGADCTVLGGGCKVVDVAKSSSVEVDVSPAPSPGGACTAGARCEDGLCVPGNDNGDPTVGAGCSMQLLGAGPLGDPLTFGGTIASAPAVAVTDSGFLLAYREYDPSIGMARLTLIPIDAGGGAGAAQQTTLPGQCGAATETDATSLAFVPGRGGTVALARPPCSGMGGIDVFLVDATGTVSMSGFNGVGASPITLANAHALAEAPAGDALLLAFQENGQTQLTTLSGVVIAAGATAFGGAPSLTGGNVATTGSLVALLSEGTGGAPPPPPSDAGDASPQDGAAPLGDAAAPVGLGTLYLTVAPAGTDLSMLPPPSAFGGDVGALAALGSRVFAVSDSTTPDQPVAWRAFDLGNATPAASGGLSTKGLGKVLYADVALAKDRALFAVEQPGSISLAAFDHATTQPVFLRDVFLPSDARIPSLRSVRDGRVAIAASDTRVAVVWTTAQQLGQNDDVGGYAVFACTTP